MQADATNGEAARPSLREAVHASKRTTDPVARAESQGWANICARALRTDQRLFLCIVSDITGARVLEEGKPTQWSHLATMSLVCLAEDSLRAGVNPELVKLADVKLRGQYPRIDSLIMFVCDRTLPRRALPEPHKDVDGFSVIYYLRNTSTTLPQQRTFGGMLPQEFLSLRLAASCKNAQLMHIAMKDFVHRDMIVMGAGRAKPLLIESRFLCAPYLDPSTKLFFLDILHRAFGATPADAGAQRVAAILHRTLSRYPNRLGFTVDALRGAMRCGHAPIYQAELTSNVLRCLVEIDYVHEVGEICRRPMWERMCSVLSKLRTLQREATSPCLHIDTQDMMADQTAAVEAGLNTLPVNYLIGPGGHGKSYVIKYVVKAALAVGYNVVLLGFMGTVVENLRNLLRVERELAGVRLVTSTIHRFIHVVVHQMLEKQELYEIHRPLYVVVDETFMVAEDLLFDLVMAALRVSARCRFLFCGDPGQLEPISGHPVQHAMVWERMAAVDTDAVAPLLPWLGVHKLCINKRQGEGTKMVEVCREIRDGLVPHTSEVFSLRNSPDALLAMIGQYRGPLAGFQCAWLVLASTNAISRELNKRLREMLNPAATEAIPFNREVKGVPKRTYASVRVGDLAVIDRNFSVAEESCVMRDGGPIPDEYITDAKVFIYNGTVGFLRRAGPHRLLFESSRSGIVFPVAQADVLKDRCQLTVPALPVASMSPGYARTVHKSQGLEAECVAFFGGEFRPYQRAFAYTAVSRTKARFYNSDFDADYLVGCITTPTPVPEAAMQALLEKFA